MSNLNIPWQVSAKPSMPVIDDDPSPQPEDCTPCFSQGASSPRWCDFFVPPPMYERDSEEDFEGKGEKNQEERRPRVVWADMLNLKLTDVVEVDAFKVHEFPEVWIREEDPVVQAGLDALFDQGLAEAKAKLANHIVIE